MRKKRRVNNPARRTGKGHEKSGTRGLPGELGEEEGKRESSTKLGIG